MVGYKTEHDIDSKHLWTSKINHDLIIFIVLQYNFHVKKVVFYT